LVTVIKAPDTGGSGALHCPSPFQSSKARTHRPPVGVDVGVAVSVATLLMSSTSLARATAGAATGEVGRPKASSERTIRIRAAAARTVRRAWPSRALSLAKW